MQIVERSYTGLYVAWAALGMFAAPWIPDAQAQPRSSASPASREIAQEQFICSLSGTSDRRIGIYRPPGAPQRCRVDYTRDGKTRSLWSAGHDYAYCVRKALEIVGLLEQAKFKCRPQTREAIPPVR